MRLNENTYPAYMLLENGAFAKIDVDAMFGTLPRKLMNSLSVIVPFMYKKVKKKYYLTSTFNEAINKAIPKIVEKESHLRYVPVDTGIIFTDNGFTIYSTENGEGTKLFCLGFSKAGVLTTYGILDESGDVEGLASDIKDGKEFNNTEYLKEYMNNVLITIYFIHNCEIEEKILKPNQKSRDNGEKHFNESKSDIIILNCNWFTELIINTPFSVTGHFRWQPCGEKRQKNKLIWIADFEKSGYHRKPTKETIN